MVLLGPLPAPRMVRFPGCAAGVLFGVLLLQVPTWCSAAPGFSVEGPAEPLVALLGADAALPCRLVPARSAARMRVRWLRAHPARLVLAHPGAEQPLEYRGRAELVRDAVGRGAVALRLRPRARLRRRPVPLPVSGRDVSREATAELRVVGLGSVPHVLMAGPEDGGIRVLCSSGGWFPEPRVQWRDRAGAAFPSASESQTRDGDGLFHVEAALVVRDSSLGDVTCSIQNPLSGQEKVSTIFLPEPFFPRTCPWKVALAVVLPALALLLLGVSYAGWRVHQAKEREAKKTEKESGERNQMKKDKEMALKAKAYLEAELEKRKKLYAADWRKALLYPDWRKEQFQLAPVTLNHKSFPQNSSDPERKETLREETQGLSLSNKQGDCNLIALDKEGFTSEKYYWEVDVEGTEEWMLGVYEEPTDSSGSCEGPQKKFRVLEKKGCDYRALEYCLQDISLEERLQIENCPQKIVIFLDYEGSDISFYNMTDGTHIFSFTQPSFSGSLYPYFQRKSMELSPSAQY